ncbi:uncharacterized protein LOC105802072 [Gossypium raimondii]|uniref:Uncharacterized protein n=2 Tax=Gossypium raimondii TaxID=29730 RepID=A0A0D2S6J1_GOSRA|nr:uncharacterized protein LOC105802072 [Gossypium raimondii]KJB39949.1 hypothetical protein B456_007G039200 [Gossypium raimondii]
MGTPEPKPQSLSSRSSPFPLSSSSERLWRPAAQRNMRNQWSKIASYRQQWLSSSSSARTHATSLVNVYLSQKYMPLMELGALKDMPDIRKKASLKLFKQQEFHGSKLLSSYKDMVAVVVNMVNASQSMRCYLKGGNSSSLVHFSSSSEDVNDTGDCGGVAVFGFWSISSFEKLAEELIRMFKLELSLKRLLVSEFLSISCEVSQGNQFCWSEELYPGEFGDLKACNLFSDVTFEPLCPRLRDRKSDVPTLRGNHQPDHEILQVYITTWLAEVNIDVHRVDEIIAVVGEEIHVSLS